MSNLGNQMRLFKHNYCFFPSNTTVPDLVRKTLSWAPTQPPLLDLLFCNSILANISWNDFPPSRCKCKGVLLIAPESLKIRCKPCVTFQALAAASPSTLPAPSQAVAIWRCFYSFPSGFLSWTVFPQLFFFSAPLTSLLIHLEILIRSTVPILTMLAWLHLSQNWV